MPKTRMENRIEFVEKNVASLDEHLSALKLDTQKQFNETHKLISDLNQNVNEIKQLLLKGKYPADPSPDSQTTTQTPQTQTDVVLHTPEKSQSSSQNQVQTTPTQPNLWTDTIIPLKRTDMPVFDGIDPVGWVARAEQFFELHRIPPTDQVAQAFVGMQGHPLHWLRFIRHRNPHLD